MISYCCKRILTAVPVLLGISLLAFILGVLSPGDPAEFVLNQDGLYAPSEEQLEAMREELGLNKPLWLRYGLWLMGVLQGDLGSSYITGRDIAAAIRLPRRGRAAPACDAGAGCTRAADGRCGRYLFWQHLCSLLRQLF